MLSHISTPSDAIVLLLMPVSVARVVTCLQRREPSVLVVRGASIWAIDAWVNTYEVGMRALEPGDAAAALVL